MDKKTEQKLRAPEAAYRGKPFWSWNGDLEEKELYRQIDAMNEMGFRLIRNCAEYGAAKGMESWIYDEDRWPSGTCGGLVTRNRDYSMRFISEYDSDEEALACGDVIGILGRWALLLKDGKLCDAKPVETAGEVPPGYTYAVYAEELFHPNDFYNGETYLDTMNPEAVRAFLHSTLDRYAEECGDLFGDKIYGVFTDEPHRGPLFIGFGLSNANRARMAPYTAKLFAAYREKYGEELCIPEIYYCRSGRQENETAAKYIDVLDDLFTQSYAKQYEDWCREHGIKFTGHILHEDNLSIQTSLSGSMMRFYEYMDYPGIDNLSAHSNCYWAAIQCASVARQLGKKFVLSELYGCTGWDMPLSEYKRIGDWQALFGINLRCPHLSWYTMKGEAKRDYPTSILHQNSWYKDWNGRVGRDEQGAWLEVGQTKYRRVLQAPGQAVRAGTQRLLDEFVSLGGQVLREPEAVPAGEVVSAPKNIASAVRRFGGDTWLFLYNMSETEPVAGAVELAPEIAVKGAEEWDMVVFEKRGACDLKDLAFAPGEMRIFCLTDEKTIKTEQKWENAELPDAMPYALSEPNVLVLDYAKVYFNGEAQNGGKTADVLLADRDLRIKLGMTPRGGEMVQPWYAAKYGKKEIVSGKVRLEYRFESEIECSALVAAEYESIECNGVPAVRENGRWVDFCFKLYRVQVKKGENVVAVEFGFKQSENIEAVYLLGGFGVRMPHTLTPLPQTLSPQDILSQGLPYYGGAVTFRTGIKDGCIRIAAKELHGVSLHAADGKEEKIIAFPPYETEMELRGELLLTVYFTRRNTFGPHHLIPQPQAAYGPDAWVSTGESRTDDYILVPQGFTADVYRRIK